MQSTNTDNNVVYKQWLICITLLSFLDNNGIKEVSSDFDCTYISVWEISTVWFPTQVVAVEEKSNDITDQPFENEMLIVKDLYQIFCPNIIPIILRRLRGGQFRMI